MITFKKLDEVYSRIICEPGILYEISQAFERFVPGYKWMKLYKLGKWDGKKALINRTNGKFYTGLIKSIALELNSRGYSEFNFDGYTEDNPYTKESVIERLEAFVMPFPFYDYQVDAITKSLVTKRILIVSVTSSGKSANLYAISRILAEDGYKVLIQVPSVMLVNQMLNDFADYSKDDDNYNVDDMVHIVYSGQERNTDKPITISTWQSINALTPEKQNKLLRTFDAIISDEVHKTESKCVAEIMERISNASFRIGTTGTLNDDSKSIKEVLIGLFGHPYVVTTTKELMDSGKISKAKIYGLILNYPEEIRKFVSKMDYHQELETIISLSNRNKFIVNLAAKTVGNTIVLLRHIDKHAKPLVDALTKSSDKQVILLDKDTKTDVREDVRQLLETVDNAVIIGTYALISTGVSIKNLKNLILAAPLKSRVAILQSIGRVLRKSPNKTVANVFDIVDHLEYQGVRNYSLDHFIKRYESYKHEGFDIEIKEFDLE